MHCSGSILRSPDALSVSGNTKCDDCTLSGSLIILILILILSILIILIILREAIPKK